MAWVFVNNVPFPTNEFIKGALLLPTMVSKSLFSNHRNMMWLGWIRTESATWLKDDFPLAFDNANSLLQNALMIRQPTEVNMSMFLIRFFMFFFFSIAFL